MALFPNVKKITEQLVQFKNIITELQEKVARLQTIYNTVEDLLQRYAILRRELDAALQDIKTLKAESEKLRGGK